MKGFSDGRVKPGKDVWTIISLCILGLFGFFMIFPLGVLLRNSVMTADNELTFGYFLRFLSRQYYVGTILNSFKVSISATALTLLIGIPLAYFFTMYKVKGAKGLQIVILLCSMSAPFIGAYSWILLLGRNGLVTNFIQNIFGVKLPSIYGFGGIMLVLCLQLYPLVFLYVSGALKNIDNSLLEASENLGCTGIKRFFTMIIPLCMPTIIAAALMVFMRAFADFGTPLFIGEGYRTFPVEIYNSFMSETGGDTHFACAVAVIGIIITTIIFLIQRAINNRFRFTMNALHPIEAKEIHGIKSVLVHLYCYLVVFVAYAPQLYVIYTSFQKTSGKLFVEGYSLNSYRQALPLLENAIPNTFLIGGTALVVIIFLSVLIAYLVVRRNNIINKVIDTLSMIPYVIPGAVVGISLVIAFNRPPVILVGTAAIMVISLVIRRSSYTIRSSVATLQQIPISIEEAAISLGSSKLKAFFRNTMPMMSNGIISGAGSNRAGVVLSVINTPTYAKVWDEENPDWYWDDFYGANLTTPAENMARSENNYSQTDRLILTGYATVKFHKNLNFKSTVTMDRRWVHDYSFLDPIHTSYGRTQHGEASSTRSDDMRMVYDNILTYNNTWEGVHNFEAMGGTSATTSRWENLYGYRNHFSPDYDNAIWGLNGGNRGDLRGQSQGFSRWAIMSYLARVSYNFDSKYYVTANFRADGSSKLAPGHKWGFFPSVSAAWRISGEPWLQDLTWLSDLKLRAGWGQSGNQAGLDDYAWVQQYNTNYYDWTQSDYADSTPAVGSMSNIGNKDLTWETTTQANVGIDFAVLDNKLSFTIDGYYKYTKDLLMSVPLPSPYPNIYRNEGEMSNWGLEFALSSVNIDRKGVYWTTDFNISMNRNRLEKLGLQQVYYYTQTSEALSEYIVRMEPGLPLSMFWGYKALGVDPETGMMQYEDLNGDGKINASDKQYIGNANPWFTFGMTNTISWKGLNLSFMITGSVGNDIYNASRIEMVGMYNGNNQITDVLRRWKVPGQVTDIPKAGELDNIRASTRWIEDGSYLKIKNITLSYNIQHPKLKKINIERIQPYITLDNMITFTNYSGYDPEMSQYTSATSMGVDWGTYPNVKTVTFGVNIDF